MDREEQRRRQKQAEREKFEHDEFDPAPPTDDDWTIEDRSGLRRVRGPRTVGDALDAFLGSSGWADRVRTTRLLGDWAAIVGPDVAANSQPLRLERGVLHLAARSSTWATQLTWLESTIRQKVNEAAGEALVHSVRVVVRDGD